MFAIHEKGTVLCRKRKGENLKVNLKSRANGNTD
jgi:hypothetical protein